MLEVVKLLAKDIRNFVHIYKVSNSQKYSLERDMAFVIRYVHSIEKGLSLKEPRAGFGYQKLLHVFTILEKYKNDKDILKRSEILMFADAIGEYLSFHEEIGYLNEKVTLIKEKFEELRKNIPEHNEKYGGTICIHKRKEKNISEIKDLFFERHSVRNFTTEDVNEEILKEAIEMAWHAPSACNRQATRVYILKNEKKNVLGSWLAGVGGFDKDINTYIMITAKQSYYTMNEQYQYIVSSSIFAGYLSLALEAFGVGACVIQRPVLRSNQWIRIAEELEIPEDEQIILLIGCGNLPEEYKVPVSYRMRFDEIGKILK